jgi:disulfide bond formation protein DsbB
MSVRTFSFLFAVLALLAFGGVLAVAIGAATRRVPAWAGPIAGLRHDLGRASLGLAWIVATVATAGSLYFSEVADFTPCTLCWYQRICMYPLALVLGIATFRGDRGVRLYVLPLAVIGAVISTYHSWIQAFPPASGTAFCTADVPCTDRYVWEFGFVSIPLMALAGFLFVATMMLLARPDHASNEDADPSDDRAVDSVPTNLEPDPTEATRSRA